MPDFVLLCDYHAVEFLLGYLVANKIEAETWIALQVHTSGGQQI